MHRLKMQIKLFRFYKKYRHLREFQYWEMSHVSFLEKEIVTKMNYYPDNSKFLFF